jgi:intraflagellar transport protein 80
MLRRQPAEAEAILLAAGMVYRAIKLNIRQYKWVRALEVAREHGGAHVNTVLLARRHYLEACGRAAVDEDLPELVKAAAGVELDEDAIKAHVQEDKRREASTVGVAL